MKDGAYIDLLRKDKQSLLVDPNYVLRNNKLFRLKLYISRTLYKLITLIMGICFNPKGRYEDEV
jgi:hypothetical protein